MKNKRFTYELERNPTMVAIRHYSIPDEDEGDWSDDCLEGANNIDEGYSKYEREDNFEEDDEYLYYIYPSPEEQIFDMFEPFIEQHEFTKLVINTIDF